MANPDRNGRRLGNVVLLFLFGLLLFASPFTDWWAAAEMPWFFPFFLWALLIVLVAVVQRLPGADED
jgi:hypothetical protein